jgi:hypothetical protein
MLTNARSKSAEKKSFGVNKRSFEIYEKKMALSRKIEPQGNKFHNTSESLGNEAV